MKKTIWATVIGVAIVVLHNLSLFLAKDAILRMPVAKYPFSPFLLILYLIVPSLLFTWALVNESKSKYKIIFEIIIFLFFIVVLFALGSFFEMMISGGIY